MQLSQLLKHYNLNAQQLERVLSQNGVEANLKFMRLAPAEWVPILSSATAIDPPIIEVEEHILSVAHLIDEGAPKEPMLETTHSHNDAVHAVPKKEFINEKRRKIRAKDEFFWAYVKFVAADGSHAYVKRLPNFSDLGREFLLPKGDNDYSIDLDDKSLEREQLIVCSTRSDLHGKKRAKIDSTVFFGATRFKDGLQKVFDLSSRLCPQEFIVKKSESLTESSNTLYFTLSIYSGRVHAIQISGLDLEVQENSESTFSAFEALIQKKVLSFSEVELLEVLSAGDEKKEVAAKAFREAFFYERIELLNTAEQTDLFIFLDKWRVLCPNLLTYQNLSLKYDTSFYFERWLVGLLPQQFWGDELIKLCEEYITGSTGQSALAEFLALKKVLTGSFEKHYDYLVIRYLLDVDAIEAEDQFIELVSIAESTTDAEAENIKYSLYEKLSSKVKLELWLANKTKNFPHEEALILFSTCTPQQQDRIVEQLDEREMLALVEFLSLDNSPLTLQKANQALESSLFDAVSIISLDIESDGETIREIAWGDTSKWCSSESPEQVDDLIQALQNRLNNGDALLIGHNIVEFDIPVLENKGLVLSKDLLWDTLLVELVLRPDLKYYALRANHNALDDAKLGLKLFVNQFFRIVFADMESWELISGIFQPRIKQLIEEFRTKFSYSWLDNASLEEGMLSCYRPQPKPSSLFNDLSEILTASAAEAKVVLAAKDFWEEVKSVPGLQFYSSNSNNSRFAELDEGILLAQLTEDIFGVVMVKRFFSHCKQAGIKPLAANLPPIVKVRLSNQLDLVGCLKPLTEPEWDKNQITCLDVNDLAKHEERLLNAEDVEIFVVEPDLITLTYKVLLKEVDLYQILNNSVAEHLWIKFSGGQSFIELSLEQAQALNTEIPNGISNLWIEKYIYGKYRIWGNCNWENHLSDFLPENVHVIERQKENLPKDQASYLVVDQRKLQSKVGVTRFNPETIYRSRYWVLQKELVSGIIRKGGNQRPLLLLIQRKDEVEKLEQYFQSLGYYIPTRDLVVGRRLELLHHSKRSHKILIATVSDLSEIINANYLGPLHIALDSFNLYENYHLTKGSQLFTKSITASAELHNDTQQIELSDQIDEDGLINNKFLETISFLQRDTFFLLKLQLPLINRLRSLLFDDDVEHKLWLLDARIEDFVSLGETWNARKEAVEIWSSKDTYESDAKVADACFNSPRPEVDFPLSIEEAKVVLEKVFLPSNAKWHDYQVEYLDHILPAEKNFLVSLPTGGGKSLLFQAPALYRSSFTNRLTIVVTPLKALMEDQVKALWKLGFYGSVDFINQDKSDQVQQIYRRLAGGELSLLFITPERFRSGGFIKAFSQRLDNDGGLEYAVYDEAHCISQWGHEFRPDYLYSGKAIQRFKDSSARKFPVLLFSATVSEKIYRDFNLIFR
jgi:hypothetical protein